MKGLFITFEGGEGCGKSTQIERLRNKLEADGLSVLKTREPGGTPLGEAIRNLLQHDEAGEGMSPEAELLLFTASRAQLTRQSILPAVNSGGIVICDRFMDSTTVYQGVARQLEPDIVSQINQFAVGPAIPDLTILIDLSPEIGMQRVKARSSGQLDRMEKEAMDFFMAVRQGYLAIAAKEPERFLVLDGSNPIEDLEAIIYQKVKEKLDRASKLKSS